MKKQTLLEMYREMVAEIDYDETPIARTFAPLIFLYVACWGYGAHFLRNFAIDGPWDRFVAWVERKNG